MSDDGELLAIRVTTAPYQVAAIKSIRAATGLSMGEIKTALADQTALRVATLYGIDHDEKERTANLLFDELHNAGVEFEVILNGDVESRQYFINAMERRREVGVQTEMMSDLESGKPCVETLDGCGRLARRLSFSRRIRQIINADGYNVDAETLDWAKRQLNDA